MRDTGPADAAAPGGRLRGLLRGPAASSAQGAGGTSGTDAAAESAGSARAAAPSAERCDLCAGPVADAHRHMLDAEQSAVLCTCGPCALLFGQSAAGGRHYLLLPERRVRLADVRFDAMLWARLGVPVGLAFFVRDGASGRVDAGYPSPLGVTRSPVGPEVWEEVARGYPEAAEFADDVEALLVHRADGADEHWIVPLDDCYRLAALVRTHWRGLSGGPEVHEHIDAFFAGLAGLREPSAASRPS